MCNYDFGQATLASISSSEEWNHQYPLYLGFLDGASSKELACQCRRGGFDPWVGRMPRRRAWQPVQVFLPGESHGQRSLVGYSPQGRLESDPTEVTVWTHAEYLEKVQHSGWQTGTRRNLWESATWRLVCGRAEGADGTRLRGSRCWRESAVSRASARPPPGQLGLPLGREVPRAALES